MSDFAKVERPAARETGSRGAPPNTAPEGTITTPPQKPGGAPGPAKVPTRPGDRIFKAMTVGSGVTIVVMIVLIGVFLLIQAIPSLADNESNFLFSRDWNADPAALAFGVLDLLLVTVFSSIFALLIAMPVSLGIALFLTQYAPKRLAKPFGYLVDLLAAVPSIIYGLWGLYELAPALRPISTWLNDTLGFIPIFATGSSNLAIGQTIFTAGIVLAVMLLPIITAISREVFDRTPSMHIEGALALGATKWEVVKTTVLPFGRAGYMSASMLGLGRALGETIALLIILASTTQTFSFSLFDGGDTIASKIARAASEFNDPKGAGAYIAAGLVLFVLTFVVNAFARWIIAGHKEYE
ncbi:phosphate ABC transporter permease subunit PstC [Actinokineospora pegani]|uniref:phosphate ABC transporter permease subunit PstC n=1 Tax=Actinokineospora pegani TaxID=2654637 RepID=UPI0012EA365E|nr:phosphate ABC transporter permease subunit PstC [Actinokineospora pegani]